MCSVWATYLTLDEHPIVVLLGNYCTLRHIGVALKRSADLISSHPLPPKKQKNKNGFINLTEELDQRPELRSCVKVAEVAVLVLGPPVHNSPYGLRGRKRTLKELDQERV